jgi:cytochrome o ubiquinol oxidase subunit 1
VAHFHNVIIGGVLFGAFAGYSYWFQKAFGFVLDERLGQAAFWCWFAGFYVAFLPLYVLGLSGMTRRMQHYDRPDWQPWLLLAGGGALIILCGIGFQIAQLIVSVRGRNHRRDVTGDPWDARTLEWSTASPPPVFNFAIQPTVTDREPYWSMRKAAAGSQGELAQEPHYQAIHMPRNSPTGFITAFFAVVGGFSLIWHIWWLFILGLAGAYATFVVFAWRDAGEIEIPVEEVARADRANRTARGPELQRQGLI